MGVPCSCRTQQHLHPRARPLLPPVRWHEPPIDAAPPPQLSPANPPSLLAFPSHTRGRTPPFPPHSRLAIPPHRRRTSPSRYADSLAAAAGSPLFLLPGVRRRIYARGAGTPPLRRRPHRHPLPGHGPLLYSGAIAAISSHSE
ncbi:hypothetical protein VPH35_063367 [Triticum aestivum]